MRCLVLLTALLALATLSRAGAAWAQPLRFGQAADPLETPATFGFGPVDRSELVLRAGPSFIDDRWRVFGGLEARLQAGRLGLGVLVPGRTGFQDTYEEDYDETYDLLRRLAYLRLNPTPRSPLYARVGPLEHLRLGTGLLVEGFATTAAWEERTIGAEVSARVGSVTLATFTEDVRMNGLVGGALTATPLRGRPGLLRDLRLSVAGVYDLALDGAARGPGAPLPLALEAGIQAPLWGEAFVVGPYAAAAYQWERGTSAEVGLEAVADRFADLLDARVRLGVYGFEDGVRVAPFDAFYPLTRGEATIVQADPFFDAPEATLRSALLPADSLEAQMGGVLDLAVRLGEGFALVHTVRMPLGRQPEGLHRLRIAYRSAAGLRVQFAFQRAGLRTLGAVFRGFDTDLTTLVLDVDYPLGGPWVVSIRSRYGFQRVAPAKPGVYYLVERRFEPTIGLRLRF